MNEIKYDQKIELVAVWNMDFFFFSTREFIVSKGKISQTRQHTTEKYEKFHLFQGNKINSIIVWEKLGTIQTV